MPAMAGEGGGMRCPATVMHSAKAPRDKHEAMGFHEGWGICIEQLGGCPAAL